MTHPTLPFDAYRIRGDQFGIVIDPVRVVSVLPALGPHGHAEIRHGRNGHAYALWPLDQISFDLAKARVVACRMISALDSCTAVWPKAEVLK